MKQITQNLRTGSLELADVPAPAAGRGRVLVQSRASLISPGTERMLVEFGKSSLLQKARSQPERVRQVIDKIRSDGLLPTLEAVFSKLDTPLPLGYCNAGVVIDVGPGVSGFAPGDRVASNGPHAEIVCPLVHLCAKIPPGVTDEQAAFTPLAAIALQGVRLARPELGERAAVFGLGLVGLLAVQVLRADGCAVLAFDPDPARRALAQQFGATAAPTDDRERVLAAAEAFSGGQGVDLVLVAASATGDEILHQAATISRKRGRIVLVGSVNMELRRSDFYEKELTFQVSCSYGPGRYDAAYEEQGIDYPLPFVRWTEQRNFEAVLSLLAEGRLDVGPLITARVPHGEATQAYELLSRDRSQLGIVFEYGDAAETERVVRQVVPAVRATSAEPAVRCGVIGAGNFATRTLLPLLRKTGIELVAVASAGGLSAAHAAGKFGFAESTTDYRRLLDDPRINTVLITTRHDTHARMIVEALKAGKHVFVEKPLAIRAEELPPIRAAVEAHPDRQLLVGLNRRFSPHAVTMRRLLAGRTQPLCAVVTINAGPLPREHWMHDPEVGGGRIVGEGCHWIDLLRMLVGHPITAIQAAAASSATGDTPGAATCGDRVSMLLSFADGSIATLHYLANGHRAYPKERMDVFCEGRVLELDNFRRLRGYGWPGFRRQNLFRQDKGHAAELRQFIARISQGGPLLISLDELENVALAALAVERAALSGERILLS